MKLQSRVGAIFDRFLDILSIFAGVLLIFVMLLTVTEVGMRSLFGSSTRFSVELAEYCLLYITFLGAAWLLRREGHVTMDLVINQLKPRPQVLLGIITSLIGAIACFVIAWYGAQTTWDYFQTGILIPKQVRPPWFSVLIVIPIGSFPLFIQFLRRAYGYLRRWKAP